MQEIELRATGDSSLVTHTIKVTNRAEIETFCAALNNARRSLPDKPHSNWQVVVELKDESGTGPGFVVYHTEDEKNGTVISIQSGVKSGWSYGEYRSDALAPILERMARSADAYNPEIPFERKNWPTKVLLLALPMVAQVVVVLVAIRIYQTRTRRRLEAEATSGTAREPFTEIGGGQDEYMRASWPFVKLTVARDRLGLSLLGRKYDLTPADVAAIERYAFFPFLGVGILIVFIRAGRTHFLWFFSFSGAENLLLKIRNVGFVPQAPDDGRRPWTFPLRWWVVVLAIAAWAAMMFDFAHSHGPGQTSFGLLVATCLFSSALLWSKPLQRLALRPGRSISEARAGILLVALLTGMALVIALTLISLTWLRPDITSHPPVQSAAVKTHRAPLDL